LWYNIACMIQSSDIFTSIYSQLNHDVISVVIQFLITVSPIILACILFIIFYPLWLNYVRSEFILKKKVVLLEIKLPKETVKSPLAMELFITSLSQWGGEGTAVDRVWSGGTRPWFSLEMTSVEGQVHFYIWTRLDQKSFTQSSLYAQFPGIEVHEVDDYAKSVHFNPKEMKLWVATMKLLKEDPYPIKTYVDYGLDKDPKEEYKVDPLAPLIEYLGSVGYNQQVWIQILVRAHRTKQKGFLQSYSKEDSWKDEAKKEVNKILLRDPKTKVSGMKDEATGFTKLPSISKGEQNIAEALERSVTKLPFDVGIRVMYIAKKDFYDPSNKGGIIGSFKQFGSENLNAIIPDKDKHHQKFNYPWQDYKNIRQNKVAKLGLEAYKRRAYFYEPFVEKSFVLNSEELATIFHFPGQVAAAPTLYRVPSKKGQAPSNLPI
jgi:hypothetical protein